jgi:hypothetical protein
MDPFIPGDIFDSRDVIARIDWLASFDEDGDDALDDDEREELVKLRAFAEEAEGCAEDWQYGAAFIRDDYFTTFAQTFAEDIGAIESDARWPATCIDWDAAAVELRYDYTPVEFDGVTYWAR